MFPCNVLIVIANHKLPGA